MRTKLLGSLKVLCEKKNPSTPRVQTPARRQQRQRSVLRKKGVSTAVSRSCYIRHNRNKNMWHIRIKHTHIFDVSQHPQFSEKEKKKLDDLLTALTLQSYPTSATRCVVLRASMAPMYSPPPLSIIFRSSVFRSDRAHGHASTRVRAVHVMVFKMGRKKQQQ